MDRRQFIRLAQALGLSVWFGDMAFAQGGMTRVRKSATSPGAIADIDVLRRGVTTLRRNSVDTEYKSWTYWANSHGTPEPVPPAMTRVWAQCHHGTPHFLTWHRAYLVFFESLIREVTQQGDFALPYWDWYESDAIPAAFSDDSVSGTPNALFHRQRAFRRRTLVRDALEQSTYSDFQSSLEGNPHGTVHVMVGGEMGSVDSSARDPVFWAHHANIDRMWEVWMSQGDDHKNPLGQTWLDQRFVFDTNGLKALRVADMLVTDALGYRYDNTTTAARTDIAPGRPSTMVVVPPRSEQPSQGLAIQALSASTKVTLTGESKNFQLNVANSNAGRMATMAVSPPAKAGYLSVRLRGVRATALGLKRGFEYRIYVNLPKQAGSQYLHKDHYLGVINSFQLGHHAIQGTSLTYSLNAIATRQSGTAAWSPSHVNLSLLSDDAETKDPLVEIESIELLASAEPSM